MSNYQSFKTGKISCSLSCHCFFLSAFFFTSTFANEAQLTVGYNPIPSIIKEVEIVSSSLNYQLTKQLNVKGRYRVFHENGVIFNGISGGAKIGSDDFAYLDIFYGASQSGEYLPSQEVAITLMTRLPKSAVGGFYGYQEKQFDFTVNRVVNVSVGHYHKGEWLIAGFAVELYQSQTPQVQLVAELTNMSQPGKSAINAKVVIGKHTRFFQDALMVPTFGINAELEGEAVIIPALKRLKFIYQYTGSLLQTTYRTGFSTGLKYIF